MAPKPHRRPVPQDGCTTVACVRERFSPLSTEEGAAFTPALFADLERRRALDTARAAVAVVAAWRDEEGRRRHATRVVFFDDDGPIAISLGRHSRCDVAEIPGAALRHALLLLWSDRMEALDLATGIGLSVGGGAPALHVAGSGAVRFGVGAAEVLVLPAAPGAPLAPQGAATLLQQVKADVRERLAPGDRAPVPVVGRTDLVWAAPLQRTEASVAFDVLRAAPTSIVSTRTLRGGAVAIRVRPDEVVDGVLLGRYERCRGARALQRCDLVSRVHALVFSRGGVTYVADVGSTNGTTVDGRCVEVQRLDDGMHLALAGVEVVLLVDGETPNVPPGVA